MWQYLKDYQKDRVLTFFNPERDPLGNGYHIMQSKIALGSGGIFGKGYMEGTQSHLNFLPVMQTDFIFTMLGEEFGFIGTLLLLLLYAALIMISVRLALKSRSLFSKYLSLGVCNVFFIYVFVNIGMVRLASSSRGSTSIYILWREFDVSSYVWVWTFNELLYQSKYHN